MDAILAGFSPDFSISKSMFQKLFSLFRRPECPKTKLIRLALREANKQLSIGELVKAKVMASEAVRQINLLQVEKVFFEEKEKVCGKPLHPMSDAIY